MSSRSQIYSGTVQRVLWSDQDFYILRLVLDEDSSSIHQLPTFGAADLEVTSVTAKGNFPAQNIQDGTWVSFEGRWITDPKYGQQLQVTRSPVAVQSWTDERVLSALASNGVGFSTRLALQEFAAQTRTPLREILDHGNLSAVSGMDEFLQQHTLACWQSLRAYLDAATFMAEAGIPPRIVSQVWATFSTDIEQLITQDPWVLVRVPGITFGEVDEIAIRLGVPLSNPGRVRGAVLASVQEIVDEGHVYATTGQVVSFVHTKIPGAQSVDAESIAMAIKDLVNEGLLVADKQSRAGLTAVYAHWHYETESSCAEMLAKRALCPIDEDALREALCGVGDGVRAVLADTPDLGGVAEAALQVWASGHQTRLTPDQLQAAKNALVSPVSLLTGLPGTGKTTTLKAVVSVIQDAGIPFLLVAPTGIAAKRMAAVTGAAAATVHRAFGAKGFMDEEEEREAGYIGVTGQAAKQGGKKEGAGEWEYGPENPHPARFIVVDESSMLDLNMLYRLLSGTAEDCRILFVGDPYQLPSVGSGDVLRDLVNAEVFPHAHLTQIFRQEDTSGIVLAAHAIHRGASPQADGKDFILVQSEAEEQAADTIVKIAKRLYVERRNFQVLSPRHAGEAGVTALNQRLRLALNPAGSELKEIRLAGSVVREGDRIMITKNNYRLGTYNGDVGKVSRIDTRAKEIELKIFEGPDSPPRLVTYTYKQALRGIRLAYAQTVHKSQGQEYDVIILPVLPSFGRQLQRNLFYTAVTRAKQKVFLVGSESAVYRAVRNNQSNARNTLLSDRLKNLLLGGAARCIG